MDDKYTFERFDNELDNGFQIYFTWSLRLTALF